MAKEAFQALSDHPVSWEQILTSFGLLKMDPSNAANFSPLNYNKFLPCAHQKEKKKKRSFQTSVCGDGKYNLYSYTSFGMLNAEDGQNIEEQWLLEQNNLCQLLPRRILTRTVFLITHFGNNLYTSHQ